MSGYLALGSRIGLVGSRVFAARLAERCVHAWLARDRYFVEDLSILQVREPARAERFMATLAHQIHALRSRLEGRNIRSARERIRNYLVLAEDAATRTVTLDGTLMDLASEIGVSHEVLYRTLAALAKDGIIARTRSTITLHRTRRL